MLVPYMDETLGVFKLSRDLGPVKKPCGYESANALLELVLFNPDDDLRLAGVATDQKAERRMVFPGSFPLLEVYMRELGRKAVRGMYDPEFCVAGEVALEPGVHPMITARMAELHARSCEFEEVQV